MMNRLEKQFLYGIFYLALFIAFGVGIYLIFFRVVPTCIDMIQNQGEEGIDCGGPCAYSCALTGLRPVELVGKVDVFRVGEKSSSLLANLQNPNFDYALKDFSYTFDIYDEDDNLLQTLVGSSFIYEREIKYLFVPRLSIPAEKVSRVDFTFRNPHWVPASEFVRPNIALQNHETRIEGGELVVRGTTLNRDKLDLPRATILTIFYGKFGQAAGASLTEIEDIKVGETRSFTVIYPVFPNVNTAATRLFVYAYRP